jgi:hypothetical protein
VTYAKVGQLWWQLGPLPLCRPRCNLCRLSYAAPEGLAASTRHAAMWVTDAQSPQLQWHSNNVTEAQGGRWGLGSKAAACWQGSVTCVAVFLVTAW